MVTQSTSPKLERDTCRRGETSRHLPPENTVAKCVLAQCHFHKTNNVVCLNNTPYNGLRSSELINTSLRNAPEWKSLNGIALQADQVLGETVCIMRIGQMFGDQQIHVCTMSTWRDTS